MIQLGRRMIQLGRRMIQLGRRIGTQSMKHVKGKDMGN